LAGRRCIAKEKLSEVPIAEIHNEMNIEQFSAYSLPNGLSFVSFLKFLVLIYADVDVPGRAFLMTHVLDSFLLSQATVPVA
jgi:hypothetical protein